MSRGMSSSRLHGERERTSGNSVVASDLTAHRLPVARPLLTGRGNRPCRTVAPPAPLTEPDPGGTRTSRPPGPRRAPRLGRPHDTQGLGGQRLRRSCPAPAPSLPSSAGTTGLKPTRRNWLRFEHPQPNDLWQMDFKGHFPTGAGRCHPLTVLDDHSRFSILLQACANERTETVRECLTAAFRLYGLPVRMLMDNGSPWGNDANHPRTPLTVWLMRLGDPGEPRTTLPSPNAGEGRAFPPDIECGAAPGPALRRLGAVPGGIRQVARRLQHRASAPSVGPRDADQPLHAEPPEFPGDVAADRIWRRRPRPEDGSGRQDQLKARCSKWAERYRVIRWRSGRRRPMVFGAALVHDASDRGGGLARAGTGRQKVPPCVKDVPEQV